MANMGYKDWYKKVSEPFRGAPLAAIDRLLVALVALVYLAAIAFLVYLGDARIGKFVLVPALTFAIVTALRAALDKPRPYEAFPIEPLIVKDTHGKSMPSRHLASAVAIACAFSWLDVRLGAVGFVVCAAIAWLRIVGGVHFPRDIAIAAVVSLVVAAFGYLLIP